VSEAKFFINVDNVDYKMRTKNDKFVWNILCMWPDLWRYQLLCLKLRYK